MKKTLLIAACLGMLLGTDPVTGAEHTDSVRFFIIEELFARPAGLDSAGAFVDPAHSLVNFLTASDADNSLNFSASRLANHPDPLRIPNPFALGTSRSGALLKQITDRLQQYGLTFEILYPADFAEAEQFAAAGISQGHPVVALHPQPYILFGYDYREADPYWYAMRFSPAGRIQITTRSTWRNDWWLWEPDPTSVILIEIAGPDSTAITEKPPREVFANLLATAKTDAATGAVSYIRPILRMIDSLSEAAMPPGIVDPPEDITDPLYLRRAERQRLLLHEYLKSLTPLARNSEVQQNLRLATYSASKAAGEFAAVRHDLYGEDLLVEDDTTTVIERIHQRWVEHHLNAADHLTEVVRWERQMLAAIRDIVAEDKPFRD